MDGLYNLILVWNLIVFLTMGLDKLNAKANRGRVREIYLIFFSLFLGGFGSALGMICFKHKTNHMRFRILVPAGFFITYVVMVFLVKRI